MTVHLGLALLPDSEMEAFESSHMQHFSRNAASLDPYKLALANGTGEMEINLQQHPAWVESSFAYQLIGLRGPCRIGCNRIVRGRVERGAVIGW